MYCISKGFQATYIIITAFFGIAWHLTNNGCSFLVVTYIIRTCIPGSYHTLI
jgi:hypothetical protein